jgi:hypothetical protein
MRLVRRASRPVLEVRAAVAAEAATAVTKVIAGIAAGFPTRITAKLYGSLANPAGRVESGAVAVAVLSLSGERFSRRHRCQQLSKNAKKK